MRKAGIGIVVSLGLVLLAGLVSGGCGPGRATLKDPTAPPAGYVRKIALVLERPDFRPVAGAEVAVDVAAPTRLVSPAGGRGRTDGRGILELVFEPRPHYDRKALAGGDVIADFPIRAVLSIGGTGRGAVRRVLEDRQTFARYADPLYQGLNRNPETELTYYPISLP